MNKENKNKGFSLIEIIVVIAILAIVTGASMGIYSGINSHRVKQLAEGTNSTISKLRTYTLTKAGSYEMEIKKSGKKFYAVIYKTDGGTTSQIDKKELGSHGSIYAYDTAGNKCEVKGSNSIKISYKKGDGSFNKYVYVSSGGEKDLSGEITFTYKNYTKNIKLAMLTGKHKVG